MSEENESGLRKLLVGNDRPESEEKVLSYVGHRLKRGAQLEDALREEYVVRNSTQVQRDEILIDPRLSQKAREGLKQDFEFDELKPKQSPRH